MDGKLALYQLRQLLQEDSGSAFLDDFTSYQVINEAAVDVAYRTQALRATQSITTVAEQQGYDLEPDFMGLYLRNSSKNHYMKYNDGSNNTFITWKPYEEVIYADQTDSVSVPSRFTIIDKSSLPSQVTGTATSDGASSGGQCTLTDTAADFSDVEAGAVAHNTSDGSMGIVLSKTSSTVLVVALFGGTDDDWTSTDTYVIQPQSRYQLLFEPPPSTVSHTGTLYYLQRPAPVYSDYGMFRLPAHFMPALIKRAAWAYKYRDKEPDFGDKWYLHSEEQIRKFANQTDHVLRRRRFTVNLKASGR